MTLWLDTELRRGHESETCTFVIFQILNVEDNPLKVLHPYNTLPVKLLYMLHWQISIDMKRSVHWTVDKKCKKLYLYYIFIKSVMLKCEFAKKKSTTIVNKKYRNFTWCLYDNYKMLKQTQSFNLTQVRPYIMLVN